MSLEETGQVLTVALTGTTLLGVLFRFLVLLPLKAYIKEVTYPIQKGANGGLSLPDVARGVDRINDRLDKLESRLDTLEK